MSATQINLVSIPYSVSGKTIRVSERDVPFATEYEVRSPKTGVVKNFKFECSTGKEFDPKTEWVYKSEEGYYLNVCNDAVMTKAHAANYLKSLLYN